MEPLPDLSTMSDDELSALIARSSRSDEDAISRRRSVLHGRIDILREERIGAAQGAGRRRRPRRAVTDEPRALACTRAPVTLPDEHELEALPELSALDDDTMRSMIRSSSRRKTTSPCAGRVLHAQIDIVRAERTQAFAQRRAHRGRGSRPDPRRRAMSHIYCPECGFQSPEAATYCSRCGALLVRETPGETTVSLGPEEVGDETQVLPPATTASAGRRWSSAPAAAERGRASRRSATGR